LVADATDVLTVAGAVKAFGGLQALRGVGLRLGSGEVLGLVGANGAGKSTLVKILVGIVRPDAGEIVVGGRSYAELTPAESRAAGVSVIHQELSLIDSQSVPENIFLGHPRPKRWGSIDWRRLTAEAERACEETGIELDVRRPVGQLSTWQRWDEPTRGVDVGSREQLYSIVSDFAKAGGAVITAMSDLDELAGLVSSALVLREGSVVDELPPGSVTRAAILEACYGHR
jgi:ribose transport system ATP-binding protein